MYVSVRTADAVFGAWVSESIWRKDEHVRSIVQARLVPVGVLFTPL